MEDQSGAERVERFVDTAGDYRLWAEGIGSPESSPLLLIMGANASGMTWPDELVDLLAARHRVIRYDHRDTGRSTWAYPERPYAIRDLATDAVSVLDAFGVDRAHVVGMSMGGVLVQLLLLDQPDRLCSATILCTAALGAGLAAGESDAGEELPGPDPRLLELWQEMGEHREPEAEIAWRVEHWRILNGDQLAFDADEFRRMEERVIAHTGRIDGPDAHGLADQAGLERAAELAGVEVPTLVIEAPADPINPPPHAAHLAATINGSHLVTIPGMGHALPSVVVPKVAGAILAHTAPLDVDGP